MDELQQIKNLCSSITLNRENDRWMLKTAKDDDFQVNHIRHLIDSKISCSSVGKIVWCNLVPLKVTCFAWRAYHKKISSATGLVNRGIPLPSTQCQICNKETEDADHLLLKCRTT
ncbi:hypothetical protein LXL04_021912 [Taraxacum kok-saghyz]